MKLRVILATATCLALPLAAPLAAHAQPVTGPYVSLEGGTSIANPVNYNYLAPQADLFGGGGGGGGVATPNVEAAALPAGPNGKFQLRPSYAGVGAVGFGFGDGFRVEISGDFLRNTIHRDDANGDEFGPGYGARAFGGQNTFGPMLDVLYDVNVGLPVFPYAGGGVGYQWVKFNHHITDGESFQDSIEGTKGSFAYNVIAGLAYPLPMVPGLSLTVEYRFMQITGSRNYSTTYLSAYGGNDRYDGPNKIGQQSSHTFLAGLRYQLFPPPVMAPAPAPAPVAAAPAPAPAKTYLVFFDWDKSSLTPRATQIIAEAASDSHTTGVTTINVSGYTDTSGTPTYNQGLSERRAHAVAAQLVTDGVPTSEIETHAYGETHLLVPTGPGVREPQNRRVEIMLD